MYRVTPSLRKIVLRGRFLTQVSHHDPAQSDKSNISLFLRQSQFIDRPSAAIPDGETVQRIVAAFPVPESLRDTLANFTPAEFLGIAVLRKFIANHNGAGLLDGGERYRRLENRARQNAVVHTTMYAYWGGLSRDMEVGVAFEDDDEILALLTMPPALSLLVLDSIAKNSASAVTLARIWNDALRSKQPAAPIALGGQHFAESSRMVAEVPAVSANALRHKLVREPGMLHLLTTLGLSLPELPDGVAALLYNGGDLNESEPPNAFSLIRTIRAAYPLLGLLGGSTKGFMLGASNLEASAWLICVENNDALASFGIQSDISAFEMLDRAEMTRHTSRRVDGSPMPFGFETLAKGAEILVEFRLRPYANLLEMGALQTALSTYLGGDSTFGGQSARGFGLLTLDLLAAPDEFASSADAYMSHLSESAESLKEGLLSGTLTTKKSLC